MTKKGSHDSQSLVSSGDRQSKGLEVNEYRTATRFASSKAGGKRRARHSKRGSQPGNGHLQQAQETPHGETASQGRPNRHNRRLIQHKEIPGDPIQDDDIEIIAETRASKQKRPNPSHFTASRFRAPGDTTSSEEEERFGPEQDEITEVSPPKLHDPAAQRPERYQVLGKTKRPAASPDEQQSQRAPKRRVDRADVRQMNPLSDRASDRRSRKSDDRVLKIDSAVCEPRFVFPVRDDMHKDDDEAYDAQCALSPTVSNSRVFRPVNNALVELQELAWMTPDLSKVTRIDHNVDSPIVRLKKMTDSRSEYSGGPTLVIKFVGKEDAERYVQRCRDANGDIDTDDGINV